MISIKQQGLTLIVNDGKAGIADGTIPIDWQADAELCKVGPTRVLLFVQHSTEEKSDKSGFSGQRKFLSFSKKREYVEFQRPGAHRVTLVVLAPSFNADNFKDDFLLRINQTAFQWNYGPVMIHELVNRGHDNGHGLGAGISKKDVLLSLSINIDVPAEVFAKPPESAVAVWFYGMVNYWWKFKPVNQCDQRKRVLASIFTIWPVFFGRILMGVLSLVISLVFIIGRIGAAFFGYRPRRLFAGVGNIWAKQFGHGRSVTISDNDERYDFVAYDDRYSFRTWVYIPSDYYARLYGMDIGTVRHLKEAKRLVRLPITPFGVTLVIGLIWLLLHESATIPFWVEALMASVVGITLWLTTLRLVRPVHKGDNEDFWDGSFRHTWKFFTKFKVHMYVAGIVAIVTWTAYMHGSRVVDNARHTTDLLPSFGPSLGVLMVVAVLFALLVFLLRNVKFSGLRESVLDWIEEIREAIQRKQEKRRETQQAKTRPVLQMAATRVQAWRSGKPIPSSALPDEACTACEKRSLGDRFSLVYQATKAAVCKPYAS